MENPSPTFSSEIVHFVSNFVAVNPAAPSCPDSAIVKHPACAAASNSSGFVPTPFSNRVLNEYCVSFNVPLSVEIFPLPVFKSPCQTADAFLCIKFSSVSLVQLLGVASIRFTPGGEGYINTRCSSRHQRALIGCHDESAWPYVLPLTTCETQKTPPMK